MSVCVCAGGAATAGAGGLAGQHQLRELCAPHHAGLARVHVNVGAFQCI